MIGYFYLGKNHGVVYWLAGTALLLFIISFSGCRNASRETPESASRPNIIFIVCDDLNDIAVNSIGHPNASMPNLQKLARGGVSFVNAYVNDPICAPSRASFLTGISPQHSRYFGFRHETRYYRASPVLKEATTFVHHFYNNGYNAYGTGKIFHNGSKEWPHENYGIQQSFSPFPWDGSHVTGGIDSLGFLPHPNKHLAFQNSWESTFGSLADIPEFEPNPEKGIKGYKGWMSYSQPFRYVSDQDRDLLPDEKSANYAVDILNQDHDQPFLLAIGFTATHTPYYAPQNYLDRFPVDEIIVATRKTDDLDDCARILAVEEGTSNTDYGFRRYNEIQTAGGDHKLKEWTQAYLACAAIVDDQLGKIMQALDKSPYRDNTIIIFTSDHGFHMGEKNFLFKNSVWHESLHVPLVFSGPAIGIGEVSHPVSLLDLYPTLNELAGLPQNPNANTNQIALDGHSLVPFLKSQEEQKYEGPDRVVSVVQGNEVTNMNDSLSILKQHYIVTSKEYSYVLCNNGEEELYYKASDPFEWKNLAADPSYVDVKNEFKRELQKEINKYLINQTNQLN